jgi:hypothetical protein
MDITAPQPTKRALVVRDVRTDCFVMDDASAIERAKQFLDGGDIEVWCGDRLVIRLKHEPE